MKPVRVIHILLSFCTYFDSGSHETHQGNTHLALIVYLRSQSFPWNPSWYINILLSFWIYFYKCSHENHQGTYTSCNHSILTFTEIPV